MCQRSHKCRAKSFFTNFLSYFSEISSLCFSYLSLWLISWNKQCECEIIPNLLTHPMNCHTQTVCGWQCYASFSQLGGSVTQTGPLVSPNLQHTINTIGKHSAVSWVCVLRVCITNGLPDMTCNIKCYIYHKLYLLSFSYQILSVDNHTYEDTDHKLDSTTHNSYCYSNTLHVHG